ncbi:hypothetical protein [Xanthomonas phage BUDD]|nr:hypothetical protein [Xanthomonas phage BUDD]
MGKERMINREEYLDKLLAPILWDWSSSIRARQNLVYSRHDLVRAAYPLMTEEEQARAKKWFKEESHSGLWD